VLNLGIGAGEDQGLVPVVRPANDVRRGPVVASDLDDLAVANRSVDMSAVDDQTVADCCEHRSTSCVPRTLVLLNRAPRNAGSATV